MPAIVRESPQTRFKSLAALLKVIEPLPFDDACRIAKDEYQKSCGRMDWVRKAHKVSKVSKVDPEASDYFADLKLLLDAMEGNGIAPIQNDYSRRLVEAALKKWER
jgi:hypothetical protein